MTQLTAQTVLSYLQENRSLNQIELSTINLEGNVLDKGDFSEAYLRRANLSKTSCKEVNFSGATLILASLDEADLQGSQLLNAMLTQATLTKANLAAVSAKGAKVSGAA